MGAGGQDGRWLWRQLDEQGFAALGLTRSGVQRLRADWNGAFSLDDAGSLAALMRDFQPDQVYYLAAHHHSSQDTIEDEAGLWHASWHTHVDGFQNVLEAARQHRAAARIFYASSSRVFGTVTSSPQDENTPYRPVCVYGVTKAAGMMMGGYYRAAHGMHVSSGILFNHESALRGPQFVSQRVIRGLVAIKAGRADKLPLGNLQARVDWGYAPDYTRAMQRMLEADTPNDYVVASGKTHSVQDLVEAAAGVLGLDWRRHVVQDTGILQRGAQELCGDATRLRRATGWEPQVSFAEMVRIMVQAAQETERPCPA
jgi:GDPmannose 4,6-dehydratase